MVFDSFWLMVLFEKPLAVELSTGMGVDGWGCPSSESMLQMGTASWPLRKVDPILDSVADNITFLMILDTVWMGPLRVGLMLGARFGSGERLLRK